MVESDSGSSSDEEAFMSAAEELSSSPSPHHYETPESDGNDYESAEGRGDIRTDYEEQVDTVEVPMIVDNYTDYIEIGRKNQLDIGRKIKLALRKKFSGIQKKIASA